MKEDELLRRKEAKEKARKRKRGVYRKSWRTAGKQG